MLWRLGASFTPHRPKLSEEVEKGPELYGPFWMAVTLIFLLTFADYSHNYFGAEDDTLTIPIGRVPTSAVVVLIFSLGAPAGLGVAT